MNKKKLAYILVRKHAETETDVLVSETGRTNEAKWLPKSQIEIEPAEMVKGYFLISLSHRLAIESGFI